MNHSKPSYLWLAAAALTVLLAACSGDEAEGPSTETLPYGPALTLTTSLEGATRAVGTDNLQNSGAFASGEQVDVYLVDGNDDESGTPDDTHWTTYTKPIVYTADGSGNLEYAATLFWPMDGHGLKVWGVYPTGSADGSALTKTAGDYPVYDFSVQADQSAVADYRRSDLMVGQPLKSDQSAANPLAPLDATYRWSYYPVPLTFRHLLSKVVVNIQNQTGVTAFSAVELSTATVTLHGAKNKARFSVAGQTLIENGAGSGLYAYDSDETIVTARQTATDATTGSLLYTGTQVAAVLVPQVIAADTEFIQITIGNSVFVLTLAADRLLAPGKVYTYTVAVAKTRLDLIQVTMDDWATPAGTVNQTQYI